MVFLPAAFKVKFAVKIVAFIRSEEEKRRLVLSVGSGIFGHTVQENATRHLSFRAVL